MQRYFYECVFESMEIYGSVALHMVNSHVSSYDISHKVVGWDFLVYIRTSIKRQQENVKG